MTTVAAILSSAARQCSVTPPGTWAAATEQTHIELRDDFLVQTVEDLQDRMDWPAPIGKQATITGTGVEEYDLPSDYLRMMRDRYSVYERNQTRRDCIPVPTDGEWEYMKELGTAGAYRFYRVHGYDGAFKIDFYRPLGIGETVIAHYVSNAWLINGSTEKSAFTDDGDAPFFPRRLLEVGVVWRFRERRGLPFADKNAEYEAMIARLINDRRTIRTVNFGDVHGRNPWDVPVPDTIPSS